MYQDDKCMTTMTFLLSNDTLELYEKFFSISYSFLTRYNEMVISLPKRLIFKVDSYRDASLSITGKK